MRERPHQSTTDTIDSAGDRPNEIESETEERDDTAPRSAACTQQLARVVAVETGTAWAECERTNGDVVRN
jgi:hypothetical protein